ncbi:ATP-binding protein [Streptomyces echinatus]|uniref:Transcriptional regulator with XRE-family HTH domain/tetratricopeptide (TPR) repeat protein n=1 Tax=Streptomyces echinatus TaxID=67293 RepID=A0A7W9PRH5_9ACTN|nr:helix-turn-helix domain-containing protein [Streptomyces echinatus]MBB5926620.1 transcriptional regulator with XRE-family HTH domain/tetratricopeptide (TPR) repeat protein [Streptomyces echinatus]
MSAQGAAFGALLREIRLAKSLTIEALAEASGVSVRGIGDLERGRRAAPQRRTVAALANGLGLDDTEGERLLAAARAGRAPGYSPVGVRSFPRGIDDFVGRAEELAWLETLAGRPGAGAADDRGTPAGAAAQPVVLAVHGAPGTGKTTLALRAARRLADRFPDGQLMLDLRGTDDSAPEPPELMVRVLKALGVPDRDLAKAGPQAHPAVYRQVLADRRCLLVLDDARDETQVRPLLPGSGGTLVLVTSRRMLTGLDDVHRLPLGRLEPAESAAFLTSLVGEERATAEPEALQEVARLCEHLPLALRVAGNWLTTRTGWSVRRLADRLAHEERRLEALSAGDLRVAGAFDLSYRQLTPTAARMFRRLSLVPGPDVSAPCAARLTGQDLRDTEDTLEELVEVGLLGTMGDRYRLHDLLCLYGRDRLAAEEPAADIERARRAMYRWLLETAVVAGRWYEPDHGAPPASWQDTVDLSSADRAREWLQTEAANWLAALHAAAADGDHAGVVEVAESLHWFSDQWIFWGHWPEVFGAAVRAAEALGDPLLEATQLNYYAWAVLLCEGRPRDSLTYSARALAAARRAGDLVQQAWAHQYTAWAHRLLGEHGPTAEHNALAAALFDAGGDLHGMLQALLGRALELRATGLDHEAIETYREVMTRLDGAGDRVEPHIAAFARVSALAGIGLSHSRLGRWDEAVEHLRTSVALTRSDGNTALESRYLLALGEVLLAAGRSAEAREVFTRCAALGPGADPQRVAEARSRLARLDAH